MRYDGRKFRKGAGRWSINRSYGKKIIETEKKADAPQTDDAESITDFPVCGNRPSFSCAYLEICGSAACEKGIVLSNDTAAKTVSETAPEAEDGSGNAGIKKLAETTPPNETPGWQYSSSGWWYATDATTYYVNGWADIDGNQYHFDSNGYMATGWKPIGGKGCYFDDQGVYQPDRNGSMMVALTFDDGPDVYTSTLLDTLEQYGAQATFFMLGSNVEKYGADVIPRMAAIGCELGNHSYAHPNMKELSLDDGLAQFQMTDDLIAQYNNGQGASVVRFPYGNSTDELLASIGRPSIMWDVDTLDWQTKNVQANISAVLDSVSPGDIILMHDIHETTVESCATIVPELINRGYELVTIHTLAAANGVDLAAGETYYGFHGGTTNE